MLTRARWENQPPDAPYRADSLASEGFIHCTGEREWLLTVANRFYRNEPGEWLVLAIDESRIDADVRWEAADGHIFPHIYGPLNLDAVVGALALPRDEVDAFCLPAEWQRKG